MNKEIKVWKCEKCGKSYLSQEVADNCCKDKKGYTCRVCGCDTKLYFLICDTCCNKERFEKAKKVKYSEYEVGYLWDENQEKYFRDKDELEEKYEEDALEEEGAFEEELSFDPKAIPTWCYGCTEKPFEINIDGAIENAEEEMYEDFNDINDEQELRDFVKAWNAKQTGKSYESDYGIVVLLNE